MNEDIYISSTYTYIFKVCKFVHHHKLKQINQLDATIPQVYYLTFIYSSTCFGRPHAHHQELNNCSSSLWFYRWSVVVAVLLVVVGLVGRPDHDHQHCYHHTPTVKTEAATAVVQLLMMGVRTPETC
jgi:protein-S-isoprenylcysteine O-methyltransferase Ste14